LGITVNFRPLHFRRTIAAATAGLALAGAGAFLAPSSAVNIASTCSAGGGTCSGSTPVALTITGGGSLSISVPTVASPTTHVDLGSVAAGSALATTPNALGAVTVTDTRTGILNNNWVVAAQASALILDGKTAATAAVNEQVPAAAIGYVSGTLTKTLPALGTALGIDAPALATAVPVLTTVSLGANTVSWSPKLAVTVLPTTVAGRYTGTVTHSAL
jgi:hypothetical protein